LLTVAAFEVAIAIHSVGDSATGESEHEMRDAVLRIGRQIAGSILSVIDQFVIGTSYQI
jgi:hypothetical protein